MTRPAQGLPGGAQAAITTSPVAVDLNALKGCSVLIWCDDDDIYFTLAAAATDTTLVTAGASAASTSSLKADRVAKGSKSPRLIEGKYPYLIVRGVTTTGTVHVKRVSEIDGADVAPGVSSSPSLGTVTISDGSGPVTVDGTVSVISGSPTKTDNATYLVTQSMAADVDGAAITVGPEGRLDVSAKWTAASTQIGILVLQTLSLIDGTTYITIPGSSGAFGQHPNNDTAETLAKFYGLQPSTTVRVKYVRTSGGAAGNNFSVGIRTQ